ncbi:MAG TPA: hypothetical protein VN624_00250 [Rhodanobacter sp.]|nr:hypothetical protein [Rhodanobacter sp.]
MKIRLRFLLPALLALGGCATTYGPTATITPASTGPATAAPQRVDAVSDALGQKMDNLVASRRPVTSNVTR